MASKEWWPFPGRRWPLGKSRGKIRINGLVEGNILTGKPHMKNRKIYGFRLKFSLNQLTGGKSPKSGYPNHPSLWFFVPLVV